MHQPPNLAAYMNKKFDVFYSAGNQEPEDTDDYEDCGLTEEDYEEVKVYTLLSRKKVVGVFVCRTLLVRISLLRKKWCTMQ